jgi:orotidine-5'-phosphate decarboxylase
MDSATSVAEKLGTAVKPVPEKPDPRDRLIVALDFPSTESAKELVDQLQGLCRWYKVGMELYYSAGNAVVEHLRERGYDVFLDLKLHDIPNTVAGAVKTVARAGASLLTVHAAGGEAMLRAAAAAATGPDAPRLLAVTVLTSMDAAQLSAVGVSDSPSAQVLRLAKLARTAGIDGLVCSAEEVAAVRAAMGPESSGSGPLGASSRSAASLSTGPLLVVPGIRPAGSAAGDQMRVATPAEAIARGASMLVVGRPITGADDPAKAAAAILKEMEA